MSAQIFFNRPARPIDMRLLWRDMSETTKHLVLASAWFTDAEAASTFINSPAEQKTVIFNAADMDRGTRRAYELIKSYFNNPVHWDAEEGDQVYTAYSADKYGVEGGYDETSKFRFVVLGSGNWTEGVMHHKFILCDTVAWLGSFNFTYQARKNYETLVRIDDKKVVTDLYDEVECLIAEPELNDTRVVNGAARCFECDVLLAVKDMASVSDGGYGSQICFCKKCAKEIERQQRR